MKISKKIINILMFADIFFMQTMHAHNLSYSMLKKNCSKRAIIELAASTLVGLGIGYLLSRYYFYNLDPGLMSGDNLLSYLRAKYKPDKNKCGAAIAKNKDRLPDSFWASFICLVDGYKDVYWGEKTDLSHNVKIILKQKNIEWLEDRDLQVILYNKNGKNNALLLQQYILSTDNMYCQFNHYLIGTLLNYSQEDIYYFYTSRNIESFDQDKEESINWISQNTQTFIG